MKQWITKSLEEYGCPINKKKTVVSRAGRICEEYFSIRTYNYKRKKTNNLALMYSNIFTKTNIVECKAYYHAIYPTMKYKYGYEKMEYAMHRALRIYGCETDYDSILPFDCGGFREKTQSNLNTKYRVLFEEIPTRYTSWYLQLSDKEKDIMNLNNHEFKFKVKRLNKLWEEEVSTKDLLLLKMYNKISESSVRKTFEIFISSEPKSPLGKVNFWRMMKKLRSSIIHKKTLDLSIEECVFLLKKDYSTNYYALPKVLLRSEESLGKPIHYACKKAEYTGRLFNQYGDLRSKVLSCIINNGGSVKTERPYEHLPIKQIREDIPDFVYWDDRLEILTSPCRDAKDYYDGEDHLKLFGPIPDVIRDEFMTNYGFEPRSWITKTDPVIEEDIKIFFPFTVIEFPKEHPLKGILWKLIRKYENRTRRFRRLIYTFIACLSLHGNKYHSFLEKLLNSTMEHITRKPPELPVVNSVFKINWTLIEEPEEIEECKTVEHTQETAQFLTFEQLLRDLPPEEEEEVTETNFDEEDYEVCSNDYDAGGY
jgi:hypothetical protein